MIHRAKGFNLMPVYVAVLINLALAFMIQVHFLCQVCVLTQWAFKGSVALVLFLFSYLIMVAVTGKRVP